MYNRTILILFALFSNYFRLKKSGQRYYFRLYPALVLLCSCCPRIRHRAVCFKPCGVFQQSIVFGAFDGHAVPAGRYNDIAVHGAVPALRAFVYLTRDINLIRVRRDAVDHRLRREDIFRCCIVLIVTGTATHADNIRVDNVQQLFGA